MPIVDADGRVRTAVWGLELPNGRQAINARAETLADRGTFRRLLARGRCLVPASGFFEWARDPRGAVPHHFRLRDRSLFAFAGLREQDRFLLLTTAANAVVAPVHGRMPVVLEPEA